MEVTCRSLQSAECRFDGTLSKLPQVSQSEGDGESQEGRAAVLTPF